MVEFKAELTAALEGNAQLLAKCEALTKRVQVGAVPRTSLHQCGALPWSKQLHIPRLSPHPQLPDTYTPKPPHKPPAQHQELEVSAREAHLAAEHLEAAKRRLETVKSTMGAMSEGHKRAVKELEAEVARVSQSRPGSGTSKRWAKAPRVRGL